MKKLIVSSLLTVIILGGAFLASAHAQAPANDLKPTFISPTPGLYVNGWPAFIVSYPKEWAEVPQTAPGIVFMALGLRPNLPPSGAVPIFVFPSPLPLQDWAKFFMPLWENYFTDIKVLSDKPSQLKDGTPAREVEVEFVAASDPSGRPTNPAKLSGLLLATKKDPIWISIWPNGDAPPGGGWKSIAYSLTFQPDREKPLSVPADVRAFLDMYCADVVSHDVKAIMAHYSDRFHWSGATKAFYEQWFRNDPTSPIQTGVISRQATVTVFEAHGDKAYIDGFFLDKTKSDDGRKWPMYYQQIINEHGQWKWFGNQR